MRTAYTASGIANTLVAFLDYGQYKHVTVLSNRENMIYSEINDGLM